MPPPLRDDSAEWRVRMPGDGRVVLTFHKELMIWTGVWEDTGTVLDQVDIRLQGREPCQCGCHEEAHADA